MDASQLSNHSLASLSVHDARPRRRYQIIAAEACEAMARRIEARDPERFAFHPSTWDKFPDGTDRIVVGSVESTTVWPSRNSKATIVWPGPEK